MELAKIFDEGFVNPDEVIENMRQTAIKLNLPIGRPTRIYNSRLAQELGLWAALKSKDDAFHMAAFQAYFVDNVNLWEPDVLTRLVKAADLPVDEATRVLRERSFRDRVDADWEYARENNIKAVPTFMINGDKLVGAQTYEKLEDLVIRHDATKRNPTHAG